MVPELILNASSPSVNVPAPKYKYRVRTSTMSKAIGREIVA